MKKIFNFLKKTNHYKHLISGFLVGIFACSPWAAGYAAAIAATCLELKDYMYSKVYDWTDWSLSVGGGAIAALIWLFLNLYAQ